MKVRIYSDLHLEFGRDVSQFKRLLGEDLIILAGDIDVGIAGVRWAQECFADRPVIYVLGNHEYYHQDFNHLAERCRRIAEGTNVHVLENEAFEFGGFRILGCTLWTDFALLGSDRSAECIAWARDHMADFSVVRDGATPLGPLRTFHQHTKSVSWLQGEVDTAQKPLIVVTHHSPSSRTGHPAFAGSLSSASFGSALDPIFRKPPVKVVIHGHTHFNVDLDVDGVRIVTHQAGYPDQPISGFQWDRIYDIQP